MGKVVFEGEGSGFRGVVTRTSSGFGRGCGVMGGAGVAILGGEWMGGGSEMAAMEEVGRGLETKGGGDGSRCKCLCRCVG